MKWTFYSVVLFYWFSQCSQSCHGHSQLPKLLLISFDGFRWDYLSKAKAFGRQTPTLDMLASNGVLATVKNTFVTKTFPNHYTIATGLFEENHGVVGNNMYDPVFQEEFTNSPEQSHEVKWWNNGTNAWKGLPIWFANEQVGFLSPSRRRSGVYFWPGSQAPIGGHHITHAKDYNSSIPLAERMDTVVDWFRDEEAPINMGVLYYEEPDASGHRLGPDNEELYDVIVDIDNHLGNMITKLKSFGLFDSINIIVTSDHGMSEIVGTKYLSDYVNTSWFDHFGSSPVFNIQPKPGHLHDVYEALKNASSDLNVYLKEDIPLEYHYRYNRRIQPIVVSAPEGYDICINRSSCYAEKGNHGYNNSLADMHPIFIGHGPAFRRGYKSASFNNVDIYPLMCAILEIEAPYNDGDIEHVRHLLVRQDNSTLTLLTYVITIAFVATIAGIMMVAALRMQHYQRHRHHLFPHLNNVFVDGHTDPDGQSHLLASDDDDYH